MRGEYRSWSAIPRHTARHAWQLIYPTTGSEMSEHDSPSSPPSLDRLLFEIEVVDDCESDDERSSEMEVDMQSAHATTDRWSEWGEPWAAQDVNMKAVSRYRDMAIE
jgi:hypothetical protein